MRSEPAPQAHPVAPERELPSPAVPGDHGFTPRGRAERPPSLREFIVRWLNEPL